MIKYKERYGVWAGNPDGVKPDFSKCAREVRQGSGMVKFYGRQCRHDARYDPDQDGKPTACGYHRDKVATGERQG